MLLLCIGFYFGATSQNSKFLDSLLKYALPNYAAVLNNPAKYKLQIIYSQINRDKNNVPTFAEHHFHVNKEYVYPASTVKLPVGILALIKLEALDKPGLNRSTAMITDSILICRQKMYKDTSSETGAATLENYIKKMFLVSDNVAFARTFEFVGCDYAHSTLNQLGFKNIRLLNRLDANCSGDTGLTPPVYFLDKNKDTVYKQPMAFFSVSNPHPVKRSEVGRFHRAGGRWLPGPKDFSTHNYLEMTDLHRIMKMLAFNNFAGEKERLPLANTSRLFLLKELGLYPRESDFPKYSSKIYYDSFKKYFMYGSVAANIGGDSLRVVNIVGRAFGFLIDCAYIIDLKNNIEFLLTACIYVNDSGRVGSGKYEYDQLGLPFLKDLGQCIYRYERDRKKEFNPDLGEFRTLFQKP